MTQREEPADAARRADCLTCRHLYVTHEPRWPHGCRVFGIKSARLPCIDVERESGAACHGHERRAEATPRSR